jgi:hypothetical protein
MISVIFMAIPPVSPCVASGVLDHTPDQSAASRDALNFLRVALLLGLPGIVLHSQIEPLADVPMGERPGEPDRHITRHVGVTVTSTAIP